VRPFANQEVENETNTDLSHRLFNRLFTCQRSPDLAHARSKQFAWASPAVVALRIETWVRIPNATSYGRWAAATGSAVIACLLSAD